MLNSYIEVTYKAYATSYSINKALKELNTRVLLSYDCETQSIYSLEEREEAKCLLKESNMEPSDIRLSKLVAKSSGLSYPSLVKVTHFIFGISNHESVILIAHDRKTEMIIFDWMIAYRGKLLIHNSLFDLKIVYERTDKLPNDYEDTQLLAKTFLNHTEDWKAKTGLKHLMASQYDPKWELIDTYDIQDYKDEAFLRYCAIDGAATFKLYEELRNE